MKKMHRKMKIALWLLRYAVEFRRRTSWSLKESWNYGYVTAMGLKFDLDDMGCPRQMVSDDLSCWSD